MIVCKLFVDEFEFGMLVLVMICLMWLGEVEGKDYYFVDFEEFCCMVVEDEFFEWVYVFNYCYGILCVQIELMLVVGKDVLFDIDWQGVQQLFQIVGGDVVCVFIFLLLMEEFYCCLMSCGIDIIEVIDVCMVCVVNEVSYWDGYDYVLVNDDVECCFYDVVLIFELEWLKCSCQISLIGFVCSLMCYG